MFRWLFKPVPVIKTVPATTSPPKHVTEKLLELDSIDDIVKDKVKGLTMVLLNESTAESLVRKIFLSQTEKPNYKTAVSLNVYFAHNTPSVIFNRVLEAVKKNPHIPSHCLEDLDTLYRELSALN